MVMTPFLTLAPPRAPGVNSTRLMPPMCPGSDRTSTPVLTSHSRTAPWRRPQEASVLPSGAKASPETSRSWSAPIFDLGRYPALAEVRDEV